MESFVHPLYNLSSSILLFMRLVFRSIHIITVSSPIAPHPIYQYQSVPTTAASDISAFPFPLYSELTVLWSLGMLNMYDFLRVPV
jgi:hypothetical protein